MSRKTLGQALRKLSRKWAPVRKQTNPEKEIRYFWSENSFNTGKKTGQKKLKKNFIFSVKHERILQLKKDITEIWQFIFCLITDLLVTQLGMRSLRQEFMLKIL